MKNIYEINTAVWLSRLSEQEQQFITLDNIPPAELDRIASFNVDTIWLMGIWQRSPHAVQISLTNEPLLEEIRTVLPDFSPEDMIGSAYAVRRYRVDPIYGGEEALATLRKQLTERGMKLILDFVPNHTGFDHDWTASHPEYYIHDDAGQLVNGQDPTLHAWPDVAQLNAFSPSYRSESIATLQYIATLCDGVRCDMAMLLLNDIFANTWGEQAGPKPAEEYWQAVTTAIHAQSPHFIFIAECYWETERQLVELGFDFCYDKTLYDHLASGNFLAAQHYEQSMADISGHLIHFLENHDEPRAASVFTHAQQAEYAAYIMTVPGPCLWHDGQFEGYHKRLPVHIRRGPKESVNGEILAIYTELLGQ